MDYIDVYVAFGFVSQIVDIKNSVEWWAAVL